ncbi:MAG: GntR family transcriptional regulator [Rhodospirillaceae bacterium]
MARRSEIGVLPLRDETLAPGALGQGPLYREVKRRITASLRDGEWGQGHPLPSETQLAGRYGVSMGTVRKAIAELVAERVLVRHPGRGTFVANRDRDYMLEAFFNIVDARGHKEFPEIELKSFRAGTADAKAARHLGLRDGGRVFCIQNVLSLQGVPVILDRIQVSRAVMPELEEEDFRARNQTIFGLYQRLHGVTVTRLEEWIRAANAHGEVARGLRLKPGAAVLAIERVAYTYDDTPVEYRERYVNTAGHAYLNVLGMKKPSTR